MYVWYQYTGPDASGHLRHSIVEAPLQLSRSDVAMVDRLVLQSAKDATIAFFQVLHLCMLCVRLCRCMWVHAYRYCPARIVMMMSYQRCSVALCILIRLLTSTMMAWCRSRSSTAWPNDSRI